MNIKRFWLDMNSDFTDSAFYFGILVLLLVLTFGLCVGATLFDSHLMTASTDEIVKIREHYREFPQELGSLYNDIIADKRITRAELRRFEHEYQTVLMSANQ